MKGNGDTVSLDFNSVSLRSPMIEENWVSWHNVCCTIHLWKMSHTMFQSAQTFCKWQIYWTFPRSYYGTFLVWCICPSGFTRQLWYHQHRLWLFGSTFSAKLISGGLPYIQESLLNFFCMVLLYFLLFSSAHYEIMSSATIRLLHHFCFVCALFIVYAVCIFGPVGLCLVSTATWPGMQTLKIFYQLIGLVNMKIYNLYKPTEISLINQVIFLKCEFMSMDTDILYFIIDSGSLWSCVFIMIICHSA